MGIQEKAELLMFKGVISGLSPESQINVKECRDKLELLYKSYGDDGLFALSLLGAELAAEGE
jgi:hypothetical protein